MSPPAYADLGKKARDVFGKGYHFGLVKLDCKTKTETGVQFTTGGVCTPDTGKVTGTLETKYTVKDYGLTFTEKWNTDNTMATELSIQDQIVEGLKLTGNLTFSPPTGGKTACIKTAYTSEKLTLNCDVNLDGQAGPLVKGAAVLGWSGWYAGYQTVFDTQKSKLTLNNLALSFSSEEFTAHTNVDDGQEFCGSLYRQLASNLEGGVQMSWTIGSNITKFGIGCKYDMDEDTAVRAKVNNSNQIGLGFQHRLREGITLFLSTLIDGKNLNNGGHKLGIALEFDA